MLKVDAKAATKLVETARHRLLSAYLAACEGQVEEGRLAPRVALYEASTLIHLCVASWLKFKPERLAHALASLEVLAGRRS